MDPARSSMGEQASRATPPPPSMGSRSLSHRKQSKDALNKFPGQGCWVHGQGTPSPSRYKHPSHLLCCQHSDPVQVTTVLIKQVTGVHRVSIFPSLTPQACRPDSITQSEEEASVTSVASRETPGSQICLPHPHGCSTIVAPLDTSLPCWGQHYTVPGFPWKRSHKRLTELEGMHCSFLGLPSSQPQSERHP